MANTIARERYVGIVTHMTAHRPSIARTLGASIIGMVMVLGFFVGVQQLAFPARAQAVTPSIGTLYDIDAVRESARPDGPGGSWYFLNPNEPNLPPATGIYRHSTPLYGLYEAGDSGIIKQHAYWLIAAGIDHITIDWTNLRATSDPLNSGDCVAGTFEGGFRCWNEAVKVATEKLLQSLL